MSPYSYESVKHISRWINWNRQKESSSVLTNEVVSTAVTELPGLMWIPVFRVGSSCQETPYVDLTLIHRLTQSSTADALMLFDLRDLPLISAHLWEEFKKKRWMLNPAHVGTAVSLPANIWGLFYNVNGTNSYGNIWCRFGDCSHN